MNTIDGKKKGHGKRFVNIFTMFQALVVGLIVFLGIKTAFERVFPFEFEPSFSLNFQQEDSRLLNKLHREDNCYPAFNGEVQCYMQENVSMGARGLVLRAEYTGNDSDGNPVINSGRVDTRNFFNPTCGRYEITASFPAGTGVFAAIWLREPDSFQADPSLVNPAINIAEYQGAMADTVHFNLHTNFTLGREDIKSNSKSAQVGEFADSFHTFGLEWTDRSMEYFVDGQKYHSIENQGDWITGQTELILNLAMGGTWAEAIAQRQGLETWHGVQLGQIGQAWEVVVHSIHYYPLRNPDRCQ